MDLWPKPCWITQGCSTYCPTGLLQQDLFWFWCCSAREEAFISCENRKCHWEPSIERGTGTAQLTPADPRAVPHHMTSMKSGGRTRKGKTFGVLSSHLYLCWCPAFLGMAEHLPGNGEKSINSLFYFTYMLYSCCTYWTTLIKPQIFSFFPSDSAPHPSDRSELCGAYLPALTHPSTQITPQNGITHHSYKLTSIL